MNKLFASMVLLITLALGSACQSGRSSPVAATTTTVNYRQQAEDRTRALQAEEAARSQLAMDCVAENERHLAASHALEAELTAATSLPGYRSYIRSARTYIADMRRYFAECRSVATALVDAMVIGVDKLEASVNQMESLTK